MLHDISTAIRELRISESTIRRWIRRGELPVVRLGRRVLIRPEALEALIRRSERLAREEGRR